jgi:hypothetical protein
MPYKFNPVTGKLDYYEAGSGSANLATVLINGNASGANDINFNTTQGVYFNNASRLREGTIDALLGGSKGIAQICAVGYELKWEAGRLYVMDGNGIYIRHSLYNFTTTPTITDDVTLGYLTGSRWSLDDDTTYVCTDNTTGSAVWELEVLNLTASVFGNKYINESSTQWSRTLAAPVTLPNGSTANGFTFFDDTLNRVAGGCTSYNEFFISFGRTITLTGTSGTANINVDGIDYLATFNTSLTQTAIDFVTTHEVAINASGVQVFANADVLKFGSTASAILNAITVTNITTNLSGTLSTTIGDHVVVPYVGQPYSGLRMTHQFRVNFNFVSGSLQTAALSLRRWQDDSIIGSELQIDRNPDVAGVQENFISYTSGASDPFVTGGFYFALRNDSGQNLDITGTVGVLIITTFQKPVNF